MIIEELVALLGFDLKGEGDLKRFEAGLGRARKSLGTFQAAVAGFAGGLAAGIVTESLSQVSRLLGAIPMGAIQTGAQFEKLSLQLEALEGSAEKAAQAVDWVRQFAANTPLDLAGATDAYAQLRTYGLDPTNGTLQALTDTMAMSGKGTEQLSGLIMAVGQAWTKQKLQGEEAMQLLERGVPVWDLLSKAMGKTVPEIQKLAEKGKLGRKEIQLLINEMGKRAEGASEKFAKSFEGITGKIQEAWTDFKKSVADAGWFRFVKDRMEAFLDQIDRLKRNGTLDRWARKISTSMIRIGQSVERFGRAFTRLASAAPWKQIALGIGLLAARLFPITTAIAAAALALDDFLAYMEGSESIIGDFITWLKDFLGVSEDAAEAITGLAAAAALLALRFAAISRAAAGLRGLFGLLRRFGRFAGWLSIGTAVVSEWGKLREIWQSSEPLLTKIDKSIATIINSMVKDIGNIFGIEDLPAKLDEFERKLINKFFEIDLAAAGRAILDSLLAGFEGGKQKVLDWLADLKAKILSILSGFKFEVDVSGKYSGQTAPPGAAPQNDPAGRFRNGRPALGAPDADEPAPEKRSSLDFLNRRSLASLSRPAVNQSQTITNHVEVHVTGTNLTGDQIGNAVASKIAKASGSKSLFFTSDSPVTA